MSTLPFRDARPLLGEQRATSRPQWISILLLAIWSGVVAGVGELIVLALRPGFMERSRDALWMTPLVDAALLTIVAMLLALANRISTGLVTWSRAAGIFTFLGALAVIALVARLHWISMMILALGLAAQAERLLRSRVPVASRVVHRSLPWLLAGVVVVAVVTVGARAAAERRLVRTRPAAAPGAPNVLVLLLDTVRALNLSVYGYARPTTPYLERLANEGTSFEQAFSTAPWTLLSHASLFTGRWVTELDADWMVPLGTRYATLAEALRTRGYATAAFVANLKYCSWETGLARGFEHFEDYPTSLWTAVRGTAFGEQVYPELRPVLRPALNRTPVLWRLRLPHPSASASAAQITQEFLRWQERSEQRPFFAFLNYMDAHRPYTVPDRFLSRFRAPPSRRVPAKQFSDNSEHPYSPKDVRDLIDRYDGSIAYLDSEIGHLLAELNQRGALANTLVVITADHGEEFAEHGMVGHGHTLFRASVHVPLVIWFPGRVPAGRRIGVPVSLRNVAATILELVDSGRVPELPGRSLSRTWTAPAGQQVTPDTIVASVRQVENVPKWYPASRGDVHSIAFRGLRYIKNTGDGGEELYHFEADLLERFDLAKSSNGSAVLSDYRAALERLLTDMQSVDRGGAP